jgi:hypothetical protein
LSDGFRNKSAKGTISSKEWSNKRESNMSYFKNPLEQRHFISFNYPHAFLALDSWLQFLRFFVQMLVSVNLSLVKKNTRLPKSTSSQSFSIS